MGTIPPSVNKKNARGATRASSARNQTLRKERSDVASLTQVSTSKNFECSPFHILHVYRHVDSEKVECRTIERQKLNKTLAFKSTHRLPLLSVLHGEQSKSGEQDLLGGAECSC